MLRQIGWRGRRRRMMMIVAIILIYSSFICIFFLLLIYTEPSDDEEAIDNNDRPVVDRLFKVMVLYVQSACNKVQLIIGLQSMSPRRIRVISWRGDHRQ